MKINVNKFIPWEQLSPMNGVEAKTSTVLPVVSILLQPPVYLYSICTNKVFVSTSLC